MNYERGAGRESGNERSAKRSLAVLLRVRYGLLRVNITGKTAKIANVYAGCYGVTGKMGGEGAGVAGNQKSEVGSQ